MTSRTHIRSVSAKKYYLLHFSEEAKHGIYQNKNINILSETEAAVIGADGDGDFIGEIVASSDRYDMLQEKLLRIEDEIKRSQLKKKKKKQAPVEQATCTSKPANVKPASAKPASAKPASAKPANASAKEKSKSRKRKMPPTFEGCGSPGSPSTLNEFEQTGVTHVHSLPDLCLLVIFSELEVTELVQCMLVCRRWQQILFESACIWKTKRKMYLRGIESETRNKAVLGFLSNEAFIFVKDNVEVINIAQTKHIMLPSTVTFPCLRNLNISETIIPESSIINLPLICPFLEVLILNYCPRVSDDCVHKLLEACKETKSFRNIRTLGLKYCSVSALSLKEFLSMEFLPSLQRVNVTGIELTTADLFMLYRWFPAAIRSSKPLLDGNAYIVDEYDYDLGLAEKSSEFPSLTTFMQYLFFFHFV